PTIPITKTPLYIGPSIRGNEEQMRYRYSKDSVMQLERKVGPTIKYESDRNVAVSPLLQLLVALRFYATGCFQMVDRDLFGLHKSTVCRIVVRVSSAIASLKNQYISFKPTEETAAGFYRRARFPGVLGAIDCIHIPIPKPGGENGELYHNRKGYCSINVQAVCDDKGHYSRWLGSIHDRRIFYNSHLCAMLERGAYEGHLLGDNGYACHGYPVTPHLNPQTPEEREYNTSHILARGFIERVFGVWKKRFQCLKEALCTKMDTTLTIIIAVAVLYNFCKRQVDELTEEAEEDLPEENAEDGQLQHAANANGNAVRRTLIENHFAA
uniref:DDE Tnp4 domain-containing protein n=1 Tax=Salmo trutta TaxID=8032 RepID=A0A673XRZ4_SALTR